MTVARLLVAGPNLTIDRTATLPVLRPGEVLRTRTVTVTPGGKGVNVVRTATALGAYAELVGFVPGRLGRAAAAMLADEGVVLHEVEAAGELRSTSVLVEDDGRVTVVNEPGPPVTAEQWEAYEHAVADRLDGAAMLLCSGSVPPGSPSEAFARLVGIARAVDVPTLVDATGPLLAAAVASHPDVVTPNLAEAEGALEGRPGEGVDLDAADARERALDAAARLVALGAGVAVVTAGAAGAAVADHAGGTWVDAPRVTVRNPIGAGDTFAAGFAIARIRGEPLAAAAAAGTAAAAAAVEQWLAGAVDPARADELRDQVLRGCGGMPA